MTVPTVRRNVFGGLVIALLAFGITRLFVVQTIQPDQSLSALLLSLPPLVVGLGLTAYGVVLAVGQFSARYVWTLTRWVVAGVGGVAVLIGLTQIEATMVGSAVDPLGGAKLLVANLLLGGAAGGLLVGDRVAANARKRREIRRTANRASFVNRLLRHDVLNAAAIIKGHAGLLAETPGRSESVSAVHDAAEQITETIEEVGQIATPRESADLRAVDLAAALNAARSQVETDSADSEITIRGAPASISVGADDRLPLVFVELLENAIEYGDSQQVAVEIDATPNTVSVAVVDDGPGLPADQKALLEASQFPEYDDPTVGFGLQVVSLLVGRYGGQLTSETTEKDHRVTITLSRHVHGQSVTESVGLSRSTVGQAVAASLLAGVVMGGFYQLSTGTMPVIGSLYGVPTGGVGWLTHLFHSVIFGLLFATGCRWATIEPSLGDLPRTLAAGVGWGGLLWFVAAGFVMPVWLRLLGEPAAVPTLDALGLIAHTLWGLSLAAGFVLFARSRRFERLVADN